MPENCITSLSDRQPRDVLRSMRQRQTLRRAHPHHPPVAWEHRYGPLPGKDWICPGLKRVRPDLAGWRILDALEWLAVRQAQPWTASDETLLAETRVRCFGFAQLESRRIHTTPSWLEIVARDQWSTEDGPGFPRSGGFLRFLADLVMVRRNHALGVLVSQPEAATLYGVSDRQFRRWMVHAEAVGLVRLIQTWEEDKTSRAHRRWGKIVYMLGHAIIERAGAAIYEGTDAKFADGRPMAHVARAKGAGLRAERREKLRERREELWRAGIGPERKPVHATRLSTGSPQPSRETPGGLPNPPESSRANTAVEPSSNCLDMVAGPPLPRSGTRGSAPVLRGTSNTNERPSAVAFSASPPRVDAEPTPGEAQPMSAAQNRGLNGKVDVPRAVSREFTDVLRESASGFAAAFLKTLHVLIFLILSSLTACQGPDDWNLPTTTGGEDLRPVRPNGGPSGSAEGSSGTTGGPSGSSEGPSGTTGGGSGNSEGPSGKTNDGSETSADSSDGDSWEWPEAFHDSPCVADCFDLMYPASVEWCEDHLPIDDPDLDFCLTMAANSVSVRCARKCKWSCERR